MLQNKITILCTRPIDEASVKVARSKNIFIDVLPFIKTEPVSSIEIQQEIGRIFTLPATVVFTSVHAVEAVAAHLQEQKPTWQIFCIGRVTQQSADKYFGKDLISGTADNAIELADVIVNAAIDKVIFFCGDRRRGELPDWLKENNIEVNEIVVYKTIPTSRKIDKKFNGVLFFSPSAVQSYFHNNQPDDQIVFFAIGSTTANEIKKYSKNKIIVSEVPDGKILLGKVVSYFQNNPVHH